MEHITIGQILGIIAGVTAIIKFIQLIYELVKKSTLDKINQNTSDIKELKAEVGWLKSEVKDSKEERLILVNGVLACLKGLKEKGCNGPVTEGINQIEEYLMKKSHD
jgi:predicted transcriptional regulator